MNANQVLWVLTEIQSHDFERLYVDLLRRHGFLTESTADYIDLVEISIHHQKGSQEYDWH